MYVLAIILVCPRLYCLCLLGRRTLNHCHDSQDSCHELIATAKVTEEPSAMVIMQPESKGMTTIQSLSSIFRGSTNGYASRCTG